MSSSPNPSPSSSSGHHVLVINAGSSSLKYSLVDPETGAQPGGGLVERIGDDGASITHKTDSGEHRTDAKIADHEEALRLALEAFETHGPSLADASISVVGHRVVHGGDRFSAPTLVDDQVLDAVAALVPLAPLHNPANIEGIQVALRVFPDLPQVAVFDTAFHQTIPPAAYTYAVPRDWEVDHGVRRYGFHGTSVGFVARAAADLLGRPADEVNLIVLHLGNGASATAVAAGQSVDTSMGLTPLEGLVMGTRSGDIDPAIPAYLNRSVGLTLDEVDRQLNRESGLRGLMGQSDVRELVRLRSEGDEQAALAFDVYCRRIRKYVGAYAAVLGQVHAIVLTGGVGENASEVRAGALSGLEILGIHLDETRNAERSREARAVSTNDSPVAVLVVPTNEEWEIARQAYAATQSETGPTPAS